MAFLYRFSIFYTTCFGLGFIPFAPGTFGSIVGLLWALHLYLGSLGNHFFSLTLGLTFFLTIIALPLISRVLKEPPRFSKKVSKEFDPSYIIIDEVVGQMLTVLVVFAFSPSLTLFHFTMCFVTFRIFDILKPWPIGRLEKKLGETRATQPLGIMFDDILAALLGGSLLSLFLKIFSL